MSALKARLQEDIKMAMRAQDKATLGAMRLMMAAIKQKEVDERIELDDEAIKTLGLAICINESIQSTLGKLGGMNFADLLKDRTSSRSLDSVIIEDGCYDL